MPELSFRTSIAACPSVTELNSPGRRCREIATIVARDFGVKVPDIACATRGSKKIAFARQVAMYLAHVGSGLSFATIGHCFGRDRTTVAHACRLIEDRRDEIWFDCRMAALESACGASDGGLR